MSLCFGTQLGKSECILNLIGYIVAQDPGTTLLVYPTDNLAKSISKNRLIPMILDCPALSERWNFEASEILELQFAGMYLALVGANSPSKLASRPVRYVFYDEVDKFPERSGKDSSPLELAAERTKNFANRREVMASSPTLVTGHIWQAFTSAQTKKRYFVPCPHCGAMQTLEMGCIKWPEEIKTLPQRVKEARVLAEAWYECPHCHGRIEDMDKFAMLIGGRWRAVEEKDGSWIEQKNPVIRPETESYNLSSLYSPWVTFGQIAQKFLKSKDDPIAFMNFSNGWLALPWTPLAATMRSDAVMALQLDYDRGVIPEDAQIITCGVDVQADCFWYTVRAWGPRLTSWLIDYGRVETWGDIDAVLDRPYLTSGGEEALINLAFIDSGFKAPEVYEYCATRHMLAYPSKGSSLPLARAPYTESKLERPELGGMKLFVVDTSYYKNFIFGRIKRGKGVAGSWNVFQGIHREYADQICAEHLVFEPDRQGKPREVWRPITEGAPNHLLDAEVYATAAAERLGVRHLVEEEE